MSYLAMQLRRKPLKASITLCMNVPRALAGGAPQPTLRLHLMVPAEDTLTTQLSLAHATSRSGTLRETHS